MFPNSIAMAGTTLESAMHISPSKKKRRRPKGGRQNSTGETEAQHPQQLAAMGAAPGAGPRPKSARAPLDASQPGDAILDRLQDRSIFPLKNRSTLCPKALYFCRLCSYHCDNIDRAEQHIRGSRHIMKENNRDMREFLLYIPIPLRSHLGHLSSSCLLTEVQTCSLGEAELQRRLKVFEGVKHCLETVPGLEPDLRLKVFGSTTNGYAMTDSDVNIDVIDTQDRRQLLGRFLLKSFQAIQEYNQSEKCFVVMESHFMGAYPYFLVKDAENVSYKFSVNNAHCLETTNLLKVYCDMDERCKQLGYLFRKLAKLSHMDKQDVGTFPPLAFPIMTIHYLQQLRPPVLPVLQELVNDSRIPRSAITTATVDEVVLDYVNEPALYWKSENTQSVGELWLKMLRYYAVDFNYENQAVSITTSGVLRKAAKGWKHKRVSIEDPMFPKRDLGRSLGLNDVMDYVLLQLRTAYRYFAVPQTEEGPLFKYVKRLAYDPNGSGQPGTAKRRVHLTPLFNPNGDLQYTAGRLMTDLNLQCAIPLKEQVGFREPQPFGLSNILLTIGNKILNLLGIADTAAIGLKLPTWPTPPELTEDAVDKECKTTISEFLTMIVDTYIRAGNWDMKIKTLRRQLRAAMVRCGERLLKASTSTESKVDDSLKEVAHNLVVQVIDEAMDSLSKEDGKAPSKGESSIAKSADGKATAKTIVSAEKANGAFEKHALTEESEEEEEEDKVGGPPNGLPQLPLGVVSCDEPGYLSLALYKDLSLEQLRFKFGSAGMLGDAKPPELRCSSCNRSGHLRDCCPEDEVDFRGVKLPNLSQHDARLMTSLLQQVPDDFLETEMHRQARMRLLSDISMTLKKTPYQQARLEMFGSCVNGFGFHTSDVDICMSFYDSEDNPKEFSDKEVREIVVDIAKIMKRSKKFYPCRAIPQAKVPIVKFTHFPTKQEGDLSLNNRLALQNSKLLLAYHNMDPRVKTLGFIIKILAKLCGIGDASRGSLSSYAYIILMLHYLQQEGVIPCLQEMYPRDKPKPVLTIEGWDAWFNEDMKYVLDHWKPRNSKSVAELWLGFLAYYTQVFDWRQYVVTIKQTQPLHRLEKLWTQAHLAIEDPFDLNHNLGCGLSKRMATYIQRVFFKTLLHFRNPLPKMPPPKIKDFLFDPGHLTGPLGPVPRDRCCKTCGVIGHIARECPTRGVRDPAEHDADFPGESEVAEGEEPEEELEEEEEEDEAEEEEAEEGEEESPSTPGKAQLEAQMADVPDGEQAQKSSQHRQRGNSSSSSGQPARVRASPQKPAPAVPAVSSVQAQLMFPSAGAVATGAQQPPPLVYLPSCPGGANGGPYPISMRPLLMTVDNRDVAVPVATAPSPDILLNMYYNLWNAGPGPAGTSLPRLELESQQDPCILGVGPVASGSGGPSSLPGSQAGHWPRLGQNPPPGQSVGPSHHHGSPNMPFPQAAHGPPGQPHNSFQQQQRQPNPEHHHHSHRSGFHPVLSPMNNRGQRAGHGPHQQPKQNQSPQSSYSRAIAREMGAYSSLDSPSHMQPGHQGSNYNRSPAPMLGPHNNQFGVHHRHGFQPPSQQQMPPPPGQQRRPAALPQYGHPNGPPSNSNPFKGGPKRRG